MDPMMNKEWTIIIRTQGKGNNLELGNALNSIIAQDYDNKSVILTIHSDNEKTINRTINFVKHFQGSLKITPVVIKEKQGNRSYPLNIALKKQNAEYISFLDYDDIYYSKMGSTLIGLMEKNNKSFAYGTSIKVMQDKTKDNFGNIYLYTRNKSKFETKNFNIVSFILDNYIPLNSFIIRTSLLKDEKFDESLDYLEDWDWLRRIALKKEFSVIQTEIPVSEYRVRNDNTDTYNEENYKKWEKSREITDKNISDKTILLKTKDILDFRKEYLEKIKSLHNEINKLELNPGYKVWITIRDNKIINNTLVRCIRYIRELREG